MEFVEEGTGGDEAIQLQPEEYRHSAGRANSGSGGRNRTRVFGDLGLSAATGPLSESDPAIWYGY
jgi:hypothetical protein